MIYKAHGYFFILLPTATPHNTCPCDSAVQWPEGFFLSIPFVSLIIEI